MRQFSPNGTSRPGHVKGALARLLKRGAATITAFSMLTVGALIAGCGGGGSDGPGASPQVVSGVAATGTALVGTVTLRDSTSQQELVKTLGNDGSFDFDVAGRTPPFILKATGTADGVSHTMFSFAATAGTANVNPLSTVAVANAASVDDPAEVFDRHDSATLQKVKDGMQASVTALQSKLKPLLTDFEVGDVDPVKAPFAANHEGLDGVFDNVKVTLVGGTLTITDVTTGAVFFTAQVRHIEDGNFSSDHKPKHRDKPAAPTVTAVGGAGLVTVTWAPVANATSYDLIYSKATRSKHAEDEDGDDDGATRVRNVTSPFDVTGLAKSTIYFVTVRARNGDRRGPPSAQVSVTTLDTAPATKAPLAPTLVTATAGTGQVTISWPAVSGATSYNLYWSTTTGVTTTSITKITDIANPPVVQTGLTDSTTYFYVVTAKNSVGESAASAQIAATTLAFVPPTTTTTGATTTTTTAAATTTTAASTSTSSTAPTSSTSTTAATTTTTTTSTPTTTTTASTTTTTLAALDGVAIYNASCAGCHGANGKRPRTAAQITAAIAGVSQMQGISLTTAQIAAIAARP